MLKSMTSRQNNWNMSDTKPRGASTKRKSVRPKTRRGRSPRTKR
jgi:hypothetical protein